MDVKQPSSPEAAVSRVTLEQVASFHGYMLFESAAFQRSSPFLRHVPFLFWLIEAIRPSLIVEMGMEDGVSYFATRQAVDRLGLGATCRGIGSSIDFDIPKASAGRDSSLQHSSSSLSSAELSEAIWDFGEGSIDLLIINGGASAELLVCLDGWLAKLSSRAVVLLCGTAAMPEGSPTRALHDRVVAGKPMITLSLDQGTTAVLWGENSAPLLKELAALHVDSQARRDFHRMMSRLGTAQGAEWLDRSRASDPAILEEKLLASEQSPDRLRDQCVALEGDLNEPREAHGSPSDRAAALQARLPDQEVDPSNHDADRELMLQNLAEARAALAAQNAEMEDLVARQVRSTARRDLRLAVEVRQLKAQDQELAKLRSSLVDRFDELAQLTRRCEAQQREVEQLKAQNRELARLRSSLAARSAELRQLMRRYQAQQHDVQSLRQQIDAITASTSWRLLAPARRAVTLIRRR